MTYLLIESIKEAPFMGGLKALGFDMVRDAIIEHVR